MTERPRLRSEWRYLAAVAADVHAKRAAAFPARTAAGRMSEADAAASLSAITAIAQDWRTAADGGVPKTVARHARAARIATLVTARDRASVLADKAMTALLAELPAGAPLPDRDLAMVDHHAGRLMSSAMEAWVRALDYAAAIAAMLWWEQGRGGRLDIICAINAETRTKRPPEQQAEAA